MATSFDYPEKILHILARTYSKIYSFEELAKSLTPISKTSAKAPFERQIHAAILDDLILLESEGLIFLNPANDESHITIKGLIKINNKIFCN